MPTTIATTIERDATTVAPPGSSTPKDVSSADNPWARPMPSTVPIAEATTPDDQRLGDDHAQHLLAARADGPQHRGLPGALRDRDREGVEDHERADDQGDDREHEQERAHERDALLALGTGRVDGGLARDDLDTWLWNGVSLCTAARTRAASSDCVTPARADGADAVDATGLAEHLGRSRRRERHDPRATGVVVGPVGRDAGHGVLRRTGLGDHAHGVAGCELAVTGRRAVDDDLVSRARRVPRDEVQRVEAVGRRATPSRSAGSAACCRRRACRRDRRGGRWR